MTKIECPGCGVEIDEDEDQCPICGYERPRKPLSVQIMAVIMAILLLLWLLL